jgi:hypothetical protein
MLRPAPNIAPRQPGNELGERATMNATETAQVRKRPPSWIAATVVFTNIGLACLMAAALYFFGSIGSALAYMRGERLFAYVAPTGRIPKGEESELNLFISNLGDRPVRILGGTSSCSCLVPLGLPALLEATDTRNIRIKFRPKRRTGRITEGLRLFTDHPNQRELDVWVAVDVADVVTIAKKAALQRRD